MPRCCRNSFFVLFLCLLPLCAMGISTIKHGDVVITLHKDKPCYSFPLDNEARKQEYYFDSLEMYLKKPFQEVWEIGVSNLEWKWPDNPNRPEKCVEYGSVPPELAVKTPARPLIYDTRYGISFVVSTRPWVNHERRYLSEFCLTHNNKGETIVVEATWENQTGDFRYLKPGELAKTRSVWDWLFGRD